MKNTEVGRKDNKEDNMSKNNNKTSSVYGVDNLRSLQIMLIVAQALQVYKLSKDELMLLTVELSNTEKYPKIEDILHLKKDDMDKIIDKIKLNNDKGE